MEMKKNMGTMDRILRAVAGLVLVGLVATCTVGGVWAWVLGILAAMLLITAATGVCPPYEWLGISTRGKCGPGCC
jgi:hypothetical protein